MRTSGTVQNYVKTLELQQKWQKKQAESYSEDIARLEEAISSPALPENMAQTSAEGASTTAQKARQNAISSKLKSGKRLGPSDMAWLQQNAPQLYTQAQQIEQDRIRHKSLLLRAKSKDQATRMYHNSAQWLACGAVTAVRNASTTDEAMSINDGLQMRQSALRDEYSAFKRTARWKKLPQTRVLKPFGRWNGRKA